MQSKIEDLNEIPDGFEDRKDSSESPDPRTRGQTMKQPDTEAFEWDDSKPGEKHEVNMMKVDQDNNDFDFDFGNDAPVEQPKSNPLEDVFSAPQPPA